LYVNTAFLFIVIIFTAVAVDAQQYDNFIIFNMGKRGKIYLMKARKAPPGRQIINIHPNDKLFCALCHQPLQHSTLRSHRSRCQEYNSGDSDSGDDSDGDSDDRKFKAKVADDSQPTVIPVKNSGEEDGGDDKKPKAEEPEGRLPTVTI
jgi:hypothetical protein